MTPEQVAAFINAQTALLLVELEALKAYDRCHPDKPYHAEVYQALYDRYVYNLGENSIHTFVVEAMNR